jgi:hypothetical protein
MNFWVDMVGWAASATVLATFCMNTMIPLRVLAIISNVLFLAYGAIANIFPVLVLHAILLPVNVVRLVQVRKLVQGMQVAENADLSIPSLLPFMSRRKLKVGDVLVRKGDEADGMFYLVRGNVKIQEIEKVVGPGTLVGEIGVLAHNRARMATIICNTDCEVYELSEATAKELSRTLHLAMPSCKSSSAGCLENMNLSASSTQVIPAETT